MANRPACASADPRASWLNQIEIVFSIIQRKVIKPTDFANLDALADRLRRFENRYNQTATPFDWRFTRTTSLPCSTESTRPTDTQRRSQPDTRDDHDGGQ